MTAIESKLLQDQYARIAELEAENAELKKYYQVILEMPLRVSDRKPTREQIAALVKGLGWDETEMPDFFEAKSALYSYRVYINSENATLRIYIPGTAISRLADYNCNVEARAAAEQHHRETVLSLLNL